MAEATTGAHDPYATGRPTGEAERLREEIAETREGLGETVEALAQKADLKAQAGEMVEERKREARARAEAAQAKVGEAQAKVIQSPPVQRAFRQPWIPAVAAGMLALLAIGLLRRRGS